MKLTYDYNIFDRRDVLRHSKELENKSLGDVYDLEVKGKHREDRLEMYQESRMTDGYIDDKGKFHKPDKGLIGNLVQDIYFGKPRDNKKQYDLEECKVELKVSPLKTLKKGDLRVKERLVLEMINRNEKLPKSFFESPVIEKCRLILLIYYIDLTNQNGTPFSFPFHKSSYFVIPSNDIPQIEKDYEYIRDQVNNGHYDDLHEHPTKYLSPCRKNEGRGFSFKISYMNQILREYINKGIPLYDPEKDVETFEILSEYESLMTESDYRNNVSLEQKVIKMTEPFIGKSMIEIRREKMSPKDFDKWFKEREEKLRQIDLIKDKSKRNDKLKNLDKSEVSRTTFLMLNIKGNNSEEFVKSNIYVKTLRVRQDKTMKEDISFPSFEFEDLVKEEVWEDSECYSEMVDREFLWSVFQEDENKNLVFRGVKFWNLPSEDEETIHQGWKDIRDIVISGVKFVKDINDDGSYHLTKRGMNTILNSFPDSKNTKPFTHNFSLCPSPKPFNEIISIRPHTQKVYYDLKSIGYVDTESSRTNGSRLPNGDVMTKQCFWFNNPYILKQIQDLLK